MFELSHNHHVFVTLSGYLSLNLCAVGYNNDAQWLPDYLISSTDFSQ